MSAADGWQHGQCDRESVGQMSSDSVSYSLSMSTSQHSLQKNSLVGKTIKRMQFCKL